MSFVTMYHICIPQGFLQEELVPEACRGLHKRCVTCSELLMQNTEKLDAVVSNIARRVHTCAVHCLDSRLILAL